MTSHDELSYYLSQGLAIRVDGITISDANLAPEKKKERSR